MRKSDAPASSACPICRRPADADYRPFCSRRCSDVDLQKWFAGSYAIPVVEAGPDGLDGDDGVSDDG
jgi:hypothetical protein